MITTHTIYLIMIERAAGVWVRTGKPYRTKEVAKSWLSFVKSAWHAKRGKVVEVTVTLVDGQPSQADVERFDREFNMDLLPSTKGTT